jgi:hypothetical protein
MTTLTLEELGLDNTDGMHALDEIASQCVADILMATPEEEEHLIYTVIVADMKGRVISLDTSHPGKDMVTTPAALEDYATMLKAISALAANAHNEVKAQGRGHCHCENCLRTRALA